MNTRPGLEFHCLHPAHFEPEVAETFPYEAISMAVLSWVKEQPDRCQVISLIDAEHAERVPQARTVAVHRPLGSCAEAACMECGGNTRQACQMPPNLTIPSSTCCLPQGWARSEACLNQRHTVCIWAVEPLRHAASLCTQDTMPAQAAPELGNEQLCWACRCCMGMSGAGRLWTSSSPPTSGSCSLASGSLWSPTAATSGAVLAVHIG